MTDQVREAIILEIKQLRDQLDAIKRRLDVLEIELRAPARKMEGTR
jgi:hypothetical protein